MSETHTLRVVRVPTLAAFMQEIPARPEQPAPTVRLLNGRSTDAMQMCARLHLSLQGMNPAGEIVWLAELRDVAWFDGQPFGEQAFSITHSMNALFDLVRAYLAECGYAVRLSDYALPVGLHPLAGRFECARWAWHSDGTATVEPVANRLPAPQA